MVTSALHEEYARNILKVYRHFGLHTGEALNSNNFLAAGMNNRWDTKELQGGLNRAIEKGWVEKMPTGWLKLTKSGFDEM